MKKFNFSINGHRYEVAVEEQDNNMVDVQVNGTLYTVEVDRDATTVSTPIVKAPKAAAPVAAAPVATGKSVTVKSPLPGSIVKVLVKEGQAVNAGDVLLTMESMKMENNITAEVSGIVKNIAVEPGKNVMQDDKLLVIEATAATAPVVETPAPAPAPKAEPKPAPAPAPAAAPTSAGSYKIEAPLPGSIVKILVQNGQAIKANDVLLTMESMKMENNITAEKDGVVANIRVTPGQNVMQGDVLIEMQ
ncbi:MAG: biotin/lipoyl-containing protein [Bacteroidales bacterium]|nr:biotin/lipoyl-containing protein [Bacteroidales bacterium]